MRLSITAQPGELERKSFDLVRSMARRLAHTDQRLAVAARLLEQLASNGQLVRAELQEGAQYMPPTPGGGLQETNSVRFVINPERKDGSITTDDTGVVFMASDVDTAHEEPGIAPGFAPAFQQGYDEAQPMPLGAPPLEMSARNVLEGSAMPSDSFAERTYDLPVEMAPTTADLAVVDPDSLIARDGIPSSPEAWVAAEHVNYQHGSVMKRGYGRCDIRIAPSKEHVLVKLPDGTVRAFKSVVAASNYTWCRSKGYSGVNAWRAEHPGARDIPSGAGLGFWGLR